MNIFDKDGYELPDQLNFKEIKNG